MQPIIWPEEVDHCHHYVRGHEALVGEVLKPVSGFGLCHRKPSDDDTTSPNQGIPRPRGVMDFLKLAIPGSDPEEPSRQDEKVVAGRPVQEIGDRWPIPRVSATAPPGFPGLTGTDRASSNEAHPSYWFREPLCGILAHRRSMAVAGSCAERASLHRHRGGGERERLEDCERGGKKFVSRSASCPCLSTMATRGPGRGILGGQGQDKTRQDQTRSAQERRQKISSPPSSLFLKAAAPRMTDEAP